MTTSVDQSAPSPRHIDGAAGLRRLAGQELGTSRWIEISQERITAFADLTLDRQWIHIDPDRAAQESPYGAAVAHGFLTLSLLPALTAEVYQVDGAAMMINYGVNKVRFPRPLLAGQQVRASVRLDSVRDVGARVELVTTVRFETADDPKPVCVAESIRLMVPRESVSA